MTFNSNGFSGVILWSHVNCNRKAENNCDFTYCTKI